MGTNPFSSGKRPCLPVPLLPVISLFPLWCLFRHSEEKLFVHQSRFLNPGCAVLVQAPWMCLQAGAGGVRLMGLGRRRK